MSGSKSQECSSFRTIFKRGTVVVWAMAALSLSFGSPMAQVTYTPGAPFSGVTEAVDYDKVNDSFQSNVGDDFYAQVLGAQVTNSIIVSPGIGVGSTVNVNEISASVFGNKSTLTTDIAAVSAVGAIGGAASVNAQENATITAFSRVNSSVITTTITNPAASTSASLVGNSLQAETALNKTDQSVAGQPKPIFDSTFAGTATITSGSPLIIGDAGLFVGSGQLNNGATSDTQPAYARIDGTNNIGMTVSGTLGSSLNLKADDNSISAAFSGNNARNFLSVEAGSATSLLSSAGIANLQFNIDVNNDGTSALIESGSSITASVQTNRLTSSSLSFDGNTVQATATGNAADNRLQIAAGLNVNAEGAQANSHTVAPSVAVTSGGLFLNNAQFNTNSPISAVANDPAGAAAALSVDSRGLISSSLTADGNSFEAIALGNDAYSSILVAGATTFTSAVAASNLQTAYLSPVTATAGNGTLSVNLGGSPALVDVPENDIMGSTISVSNNSISALAVANRDPLLISITGTSVTDGISQVALTASNNTASSLASSAGISAISTQAVTDSNVTATNTGAGINLSAGGYPVSTGAAGPRVSEDAFIQSGNTISAMANLNEGLVAVGVTANELNASTAAASVQFTNGSNVSATTSGTITTGVNTRTSGYATNPANISILVGDGDLTDNVKNGNTISSVAGGNLNATALDVNVSTTMQVTNVIDRDGASSNVLAISTTPGTSNEARAEMSVLTEQRIGTLSPNSVTATTDYSQIAGTLRISGDSISDSSLNVDGNNVLATARGNLTSNSLDFSALAVNMTGAELGASSSAAGSNLASSGAVQFIGGQSTVTATIIGGTNNASLSNSEIIGYQAGSGDLTNVTMTVNGNSAVAAATGNTAISSVTGTGGVLVQDAPGTLAGTLNIAAVPTTALTTADTAVAHAVVQSNAGTVAATLGATQYYDIIARTQANNTLTNNSKDIISSTIEVDGNTVVALAAGSSADVSTRLAFNTQETSAATAVQQAQSGSTTATVGGAGGVNISASSPQNTNFVNTTISTSSNTAGAQATGAEAKTSLTAGGDNTVTMSSGYATGAAAGAAATISAAGATSARADYMLGVQQNISGATTATADDISVSISSARLFGSSLTADSNQIVAQATGGTSAADLALKADGMTAGGTAANTVNAALTSDQRISAAVAATLTASDVTAGATNLYQAATGTNGTEAISVSGNTLIAGATGVSAANAITTDVKTSVAGDDTVIAGGRTASTTGGVSGTQWDRLILSNQTISAGGTVNATALNNGVGITVSGAVAPYTAIDGIVDGDALTLDRNTIIAQGVGGSSSNTIATTAGTAITMVSHAIVANQSTASTVAASNTDAEALMYIENGVVGSSLSASGNALVSSATGLSGDNTITMSAPAAITDGTASVGYTPATNLIMSQQTVAATGGTTVSSALDNSLVKIHAAQNSVGYGVWDVIGSSVAVENNFQDAYAKGADNSNRISAESGSLGTTWPEGVGFAILAAQSSAGTVTASNSNSSTEISVYDGSVDNSHLSLSSNSISAIASNLTSANTLEAVSKTSNFGDRNVSNYDTMLPLADADRLIVSSQVVSSTGNVTATVTNPNMEIYVYDELQLNSNAGLKDNRIVASATVARDTNELTNTAKTYLNSSSLIASQQYSDANATAANNGANVEIYIDYPIIDSTAALTGNQVAASATGVTSANTLTVKGSTVEGFNNGNLYSWADFSSAPYHSLSALSAISSEQTTTGAISATVDSPSLSITSWGDSMSNATVDLKNNLVQASSTGASATNTLNQLADTAMINAPAMIAATQTITNSSTATVSNASLWLSHVDGDIYNSKLSIDSNTVQAVAMGGTMKNYLDPASGTANVLGGEPDPTVTTDYNEFMGNYVISSRQVSDAWVAATVDGNPRVGLYIDFSVYDNSVLSASGNSIRAQATNLDAANTLITKAGTNLDFSNSAILSFQNIDGNETSAYVTGPAVTLDAEDLYGKASVDNNMAVALATGGSVKNDLSVSGLSIMGFGPVNLTETSGIVGYAASSDQSIANIHNLQGRYSDVFATIDDDDEVIQIMSTLMNVTGATSVSSNIVAAEARGLVATNSLKIKADTTNNGGSAVLGSAQLSEGVTIATVASYDSTGVISLVANDVTGTVKVDSNTVLAAATSNLAVNSLTATAGTEMLNLGTENTSTIGIPHSTTNAGFVLQNSQMSSVLTQATVQYFVISSDVNSLAGTASVDSNSIVAETRGNASQNSMILNAGTTLNASASLVNAQSNWGSLITSSVDFTGIALGINSVTGTNSVSGNTIQASGTGNLAINSMDITGMFATATGGSTGALTATADFTALNYQSNIGSSVSSTVGNAGIVLMNDSTTGTASLLNNAILADATGNSASNVFTLNAVGAPTTADFAFNGYQSNLSGAVSSSISNATISLSSAAGTGTFKANGNRIGATSIGNVSVSSIKAGK